MRIIGYTYEADYHCTDCTEKRFGKDDLDLRLRLTTKTIQYIQYLAQMKYKNTLPVENVQ